MIKFAVGGTAYGDLPPIVDSAGLPVVPTSVTFKTYKNGSTTATGDSVTLITHADDDGLYGWSYNPAGEVEFDTWRLQVLIVIAGVDYYHHETIQAVVPERGTDNVIDDAISVVADTGSTVTQIEIKSSEITPTVIDQWKGRILIFDKTTTTVNLRGQGTPIDGNTTTAITIAVGNALTTVPDEDDTFKIF